MKKLRVKRDFKFTITFRFLFAFVLLSPPNYLGMSITPKSITNEKFTTWNETERTEKKNQDGKLNNNLLEYLEFVPLSVIGTCTLFFLTFSNVMFGTIVAFFNDQPLNRQCLLLYLYKDLMKLILTRVWLLSLELGWYEINKEGNYLGKAHAIIIEAASSMSNLAILLIMTIISLHELFIATSKLTDPFLVHFGYDDEKMIKALRCLSAGCVVSYTVVTSLLGLHSIKYYHLIGTQTKLMDLPAGSFTNSILHAIITFLWASIYSTTKVLEKYDDSKLRKYRIPSERQKSTCSANSGENTKNETPVALPKIMGPTFFIISIVIIVAILFILLGRVDYVHYILIQQLLIGVSQPTLIIWKNTALVFYLKRTTINHISRCPQFYQVVKCPSKFQRRSTKVNQLHMIVNKV